VVTLLHWRAPVVLAYATFVLVGVGVGAGGVLLPAQIEDYGVDRATIGITFFTFSAGFMLAGTTAGALIERFGFRISLVAGTGAFAVAALYLASRPPFVAFVVVQVVAGYGIGMLESALNAYLTKLAGATTLLNRLHAFFGVGALIGPLLAAWMLRFLPWPAVWLVLAVACLPLLAGFLAAYPPRVPSAPAPAGNPESTISVRSGLLTTVLRQPAVLLGAVLLAVYVGLEISVGNWGFSYLLAERGQPDLLAGYTISGYWLGLTLGRFVISPIATRVGLSAVGMTFTCLGGVTASAMLIWLAPATVLASAGFALLGFFLGPIFPTTMAVTPQLTTTRLVPTAIGVMNGVSVIGGAAFPWLAGAITQGVGLWTLLPFAVVLALVQLVIWWRLAARMTTTA
jgi:fucose permease